MARRRLRVVAVVPTEDRRGVRILTSNPAATRGGVDELELAPLDVFRLIAQLGEVGSELLIGDAQGGLVESRSLRHDETAAPAPPPPYEPGRYAAP